MKLSLRLTLAMVGLVVVTAVATQWLADRRLVSVFLPAELARLDGSARSAVASLDDRVSDAARALEGFTNSAALEGMMRARAHRGVDPQTGVRGAQWKQALEHRFEAEMESHSVYVQFRVLDGADGRELVRVDRSGPGGGVRVVPGEELQAKTERPYFRRAMAAPPHQVVVSPVELERDNGRILQPPVPVVRVLLPVSSSSGRPPAVLAINLSMTALVADLPPPSLAETRTYLVNASGDFLFHPDSSRAFAFEFGRRYRLADEFPSLAGVSDSARFAPVIARDRQGRSMGVAVARADLAGGPPVLLVRAVPREVLLAPMRAVRRAGLLAGALAAALATLLALLVARRITVPLEQMTRAVRRFDTEHPLGLRPEAAGELKNLVVAMEAMESEIRKKSAELRESEARLRLALAASHTGVWEWNLRTNDVYWSDGALRIIGRTPEPRLEGFTSLLHPDDRERARSAVDRAIRSRSDLRDEFRIVDADGRVRWMSTVGMAQYDADDRPVRMVGTVQDVTARREAAEALRVSEERFREMAETIDEVVWMIDPDRSRVLYVSPAYERVWGRSRSDLYADPTDWRRAVHPEDRLAFAEAREHQNDGTYDEQFRIVRPDGEVRWIHDRSYPVRDAAGNLIRVVGVAEDVTRQRALEEQFRQAQKMESIGRLAGGVAHDFNNILTVIQGHLALVRAAGPGSHAESLEQIAQAAERAAGLTRQLLAFSRRQPLEQGVHDLGTLVRNLSRFLERLLGEDVKLELVPGPGVPPVLADVGMLEQVLMNLAVNARDAMPEGGRLTIRTSFERMGPAEARRHPDAPGGPLVCLEVADTGTGMDAATLQHVFEPFFTTKDVGKGTGLGLATVYGIVQQHHGWVSVESLPGQGTTFRVWLPPAGASEAADERRGAERRPERGSETILLVEDEPSVRELLRGVLERQGYRVVTAHSGRHALRVWAEQGHEIRLVLTDIVMPDGLNGRELLERLRAQRPGLPVLCMSGYTAEAVGDGAGVDPSVPYLRKPFPPTELLATVRRLLDEHAAAGRGAARA